ncbi:MAG: D-alanyl-D-alanine carboxypeptidase [Rickettsiales bacterium]|nr:D-alanyl-D-alanine carboxypeptidase [Rickettsiales bacterium]
MKKFSAFLTAIFMLFGTGISAAMPEIKSPYAILVDYDSGKVLFERGSNVPASPSSMSKILTIYRVFELVKDGTYDMDDEFTVGEEAWRKARMMNANSGSTMFLELHEKVRLEDLIRGVIVNSGNDAAVVLAENISGSEDAFAVELNRLAARLGLKDTHVVNASGWYDKDHLMSAADLAFLTRRLIADFPEYYPYFSEKEFLYKKDLTGNKDNRNKLLWIMPSADGLKTGHTTKGGYGLAASAKKGGRRLISVVNGLKGANPNFARFVESKSLLEWGFREWTNLVYFDVGARVVGIPVWFGSAAEVPAGVDRKVLVTGKSGEAPAVELRATYMSPVPAPVAKGDRLGVLALYIGGNKETEYDLVALEDVRRSNFVLRIFQNIKQIILRIVS